MMIDTKLDKCVSIIRKQVEDPIKIAVILGSGLGSFADNLENKFPISTKELPFYPRSTVPGHAGNLVFGKLDEYPILAVQGRTHFYEGHSIQDVTFVVRLMQRLGVESILITNASGGINHKFIPGDFMIITDQINFMFANPLRGPSLGKETRWPDMMDAYNPEYISLIESVGRELKIPLKKGVLFSSSGPTYETAAEVRMAKILGADAASMSTVPEVLVARANGIKVAGISCITNMATGISREKLSHHEVTQIANSVSEKFQLLVHTVLNGMAERTI